MRASFPIVNSFRDRDNLFQVAKEKNKGISRGKKGIIPERYPRDIRLTLASTGGQREPSAQLYGIGGS